MKEKLNPLVEEYRRINSKPRYFRVLSILYITNIFEKRKINSNAVRVNSSKFPEKQEVRTKLGAFKIIIQRGCPLNNQGQKLLQLWCALNQDIYGISVTIYEIILFVILQNQPSRDVLLKHVLQNEMFLQCSKSSTKVFISITDLNVH